MTAPINRVIALSFYDGPVEGFVKNVTDDRVYFFKVVAWDDRQDRRLYLLGNVADNMYQELLEILTAAGQLTSSEACVPSWSFSDGQLRVRADRIVDVGRSSLDGAELMVLGESLLDTFEVVSPNDAQLTNAKILSHADMPGELTDWLALKP